MGVVSRNCMWLECMGVASGCGCKDNDFAVGIIIYHRVGRLYT